MHKFNLANAYATLRPAHVALVNGLSFVCEFPGFKA